MKFFKEHQEDIFDAFSRHGYTRSEFHFIKRRGRIITKHRHSQATFSYFLKKDVQLKEETGDFEDASYFEVKFNEDQAVKLFSWNDVMMQFDKWLKLLDK